MSFVVCNWLLLSQLNTPNGWMQNVPHIWSDSVERVISQAGKMLQLIRSYRSLKTYDLVC